MFEIDKKDDELNIDWMFFIWLVDRFSLKNLEKKINHEEWYSING